MNSNSIPDRLSTEERAFLLQLARESIGAVARGEKSTPIDHTLLPPIFLEWGVVFVTLTINGELRGCVGALEAYQPLIEDVREHAIAAAFSDFRFPPLGKEELDRIEIEISRLTIPQEIIYDSPDDLLKKLRPNVDGVILQYGSRRATFLPQVWEKLPEPVMFLNHLCEKMGVNSQFWRQKKLSVFTYQVEMFHE